MTTTKARAPEEHVLVRQSEDRGRVFVAPPAAAASDSWTLAFAEDDGRIAMGDPTVLDRLKSARIVEIDGRLEPQNAAILERLTAPQIVRVSNNSRGPRSSLLAPALAVAWRTASSYTLPDLAIGPRTSRLVMEISDAGGVMSPANRRFLPALPDEAMPVREVVLDFSRWSCCVVDPFVADGLYRAIAHLLVRGTRVVLMDFATIFACMADVSVRPTLETHVTSLPPRAENGVQFHVLNELRLASPGRPPGASDVLSCLDRLSLLSHDEYARLPSKL